MWNMLLRDKILAAADSSQVAGLSRFFKTGPGQYGEGDKFLGIKVPVTRAIVKECWRETGFEELEECLTSGFHEMRLAALLCLVEIFSHARKDAALRQRCVDLYLSHTQFINNWDLVDLSCYPLLGAWLLESDSRDGEVTAAGGVKSSAHTRGKSEDGATMNAWLKARISPVPKDRQILYELARNGATIWERRIGVVSTMAFVRKGQLDDTYAIAEIFLADGKSLHDLLQKAVGWLLREAGKHDPERLLAWLRVHHLAMPRTMLRYSIEKFSDDIRAEFVN